MKKRLSFCCFKTKDTLRKSSCKCEKPNQDNDDAQTNEPRAKNSIKQSVKQHVSSCCLNVQDTFNDISCKCNSIPAEAKNTAKSLKKHVSNCCLNTEETLNNISCNCSNVPSKAKNKAKNIKKNVSNCCHNAEDTLENLSCKCGKRSPVSNVPQTNVPENSTKKSPIKNEPGKPELESLDITLVSEFSNNSKKTKNEDNYKDKINPENPKIAGNEYFPIPKPDDSISFSEKSKQSKKSKNEEIKNEPEQPKPFKPDPDSLKSNKYESFPFPKPEESIIHSEKKSIQPGEPKKQEPNKSITVSEKSNQPEKSRNEEHEKPKSQLEKSEISDYKCPYQEPDIFNDAFIEYSLPPEENYVNETIFLNKFFINHPTYLTILSSIITQLDNPRAIIVKIYQGVINEIKNEACRLISETNDSVQKEQIMNEGLKLVNEVNEFQSDLFKKLKENRERLRDLKNKAQRLWQMANQLQNPTKNNPTLEQLNKCSETAKEFQIRLNDLIVNSRTVVFGKKIKTYQRFNNQMGYLYLRKTVDLRFKREIDLKKFIKKGSFVRFRVLNSINYVVIGRSKFSNDETDFTIVLYNPNEDQFKYLTLNGKNISRIETAKNFFAFKYFDTVKNEEKLVVYDENLALKKQLVTPLALVGASTYHLYLIDNLTNEIQFLDWNLGCQAVIPFQCADKTKKYYIEKGLNIEQFYLTSHASNVDNDEKDHNELNKSDLRKYFKYGFLVNEDPNGDKLCCLIYDKNGNALFKTQMKSRKCQFGRTGEPLVLLESNKINYVQLDGKLTELIQFSGVENFFNFNFAIDRYENAHVLDMGNLILYV